MIRVAFSADATLRICERRWFLTSLVAHPTAKKDWLRREAHILRQLAHPSAWAGRLIHMILEKHVLPAVYEGTLPDINDILGYGRNLMTRQAEFSQKKLYCSISKTKAGGDFCALFVMGSATTQEIIEDFYALSHLGFTAPGACHRLAFTLALADHVLRERRPERADEQPWNDEESMGTHDVLHDHP